MTGYVKKLAMFVNSAVPPFLVRVSLFDTLDSSGFPVGESVEEVDCLTSAACSLIFSKSSMAVIFHPTREVKLVTVRLAYLKPILGQSSKLQNMAPEMLYVSWVIRFS